jgi:methyl-accepting chemotaxis protein
MTWFYNLKIAQKLALGFGLCLMLAALIGGIAISRMAQMDSTSSMLNRQTVAGLVALERFSAPIRQFRTTEYRAVLSDSDQDQWQKDEARLTTLRSDAEQGLEDYGKSVTETDDKQRYTKVTSEWHSYLAMHDGQLVPTLNSHDLGTGKQLLNKTMRDPFLQLSDDLDQMAEWNAKHGDQLSRAAKNDYLTGRAIVLGLLVLAISIGILWGVFITRYVTGTTAQISGRLLEIQTICIANLGTAMQAMERGDLMAQIVTTTTPLEIHSQDEFGDMAATFNAMLGQVQSAIGSFRTSQASLAALVRSLQASAAQVASASGTLSTTAQQVGAASEEITASMQEVTAASEQSAQGAGEIAQGGASQAAALAQGSVRVKQLSESVHGVAADAEDAALAARGADAAALEGAQTVGQSVQNMQGIHRTVSEATQTIGTLGEASRRIGGIVQTIDEIAGQTNLLALNAAIEAARAGDAGRGFAVVADEVRKLAERSAAATREIGVLIDDVQTRTEQAIASMQAGSQEVADGRALAEQAGQALARIQAVVGTVTERVGKIQSATAQMTQASDEVTRAITEVAAVVEESSAAAEQMSASAGQVAASVQTVAGTVSQQSGAVDEMAASARALAGVAQDLEAATAQFRVSDTDVQGEPALRLLRAA